MPEEKLMFADEAARAAAIEELEESPDNLDKLEAIRNAEIGTPESTESPNSETPPPEENPDETTPDPLGVVSDDGKNPPDPATAPASTDERIFTISSKDLPEGFDSPGKVFKSFSEAQALIGRQTTFIKEKLSQSTPVTDNAAIARAEKAEQALEALKKAGGIPEAGTTRDIATVQGEISRIDAIQAELDAELEKDPENAFTPEYQAKVREITKIQSKNLNALTNLYTQAQSEIAEAKAATSEIVASTQQSAEAKRRAEAVNAVYAEMDKIDVPELKLSRKSRDVENDYIQWRDDVALAYYGRPAKDDSERFAALDQLQLRNPELLSKCQIMNTSVEPTEDVERYIKLAELSSYRDGWRKDPATGQYTRLMRYDATTGTSVPLVLPSIKAAFEQQRVDEGYYANLADKGFQEGAQSLAKAASRRDQGAVTLDSGADQGQTVGTIEQAIKILNEDPEMAMEAFRKGDRAPMDKMNAARKQLGMDPIVFED